MAERNAGTPFIWYALVATLLVVAYVALAPELATAFMFGMQVAPFKVLFTVLLAPGTGDWFYRDEVQRLLGAPSPILLLGHLSILMGGIAYNRGRWRAGVHLIGWASAAILGFMAAGYLAAMIGLLDLKGDKRWMVPIYLTVPVVYMGSAAAVFAVAWRIRRSKAEDGAPRPKGLVRAIRHWAAASGLSMLALIAAWHMLVTPYNVLRVGNTSGKKVVLVSAWVDDVFVDLEGAVLKDFYSDGRTRDRVKKFLIGGKVFNPKIRVSFRFEGDDTVKEFVASAYSGWKFECEFFVVVDTDHMRAFDCKEPEIYGFD